MSKTYTNTTKCCATCANWGGQRKEKYNTYSETESPDVRGKCYAGISSTSPLGPCSCEGSYCSKYQKWSALK